MKKLLLSLIICIIAVNLQAQTNYTWTGATSSNWSTASNWSPSGIPDSLDNITINTTGTGTPQLSANAKVNNITMSAKTLDLDGYNLKIKGTTSLTGGTIGTGTGSVTFQNSTTTLTGTAFNADVYITAANIAISGTTFDKPVHITKTGSSADGWNGGNTFNSTFDFTSTGSGNSSLNWTGANYYNGNVTFSNTGSGIIKLTESTGTSTIATGKTITVGGSGFSSGSLYLNRLIQNSSDTTAQSLTFTGTASLYVENSTLYGRFTYTGPNSFITTSTFNKPVDVTKNGSGAEIWNGGNTFNSTFKFTITGSGSSSLNWTGSNYYNDNITFNSTGSGTIKLTGSMGTSTLASSKTINIGTFSSGNLYLNRLTTATAQNITLTGSASLYLENSTFNAALTYTGPSFYVTSNTFNGTVTLTKNGSASNISNGGNSFNYPLYITLSAGSVDLNWALINYFNDNVVFENTGSGQIRLSGSTGTNILASGKTITAGTFSSGTLNLNRLTQTGTTAQNLTLTGSATLNLSTASIFSGAVTVSSPNVIIEGVTFNGDLTVTKTSSSSNFWGSNTYNGTTNITNNGTGYINLSYATTVGDVYNGNVTFTKGSTGDILLAGFSSTVNYKANVTLNGITSTQFTGSQMGIFSGTTAQSINGSGAINFGKLTINNTAADITLNTPVTINTSLTLTDGRVLSSSTNLLSFANDATVNGAKDSSFVLGPVKKTGDEGFTFPTGKGNRYRPLTIGSQASTATVFTAEYFNANQSLGTSADTSVANLSDCEYWALTRSGSPNNVAVGLSWNAATCNSAVPANMRVVGWNGSQWTNYGNSAYTGNVSAGTVTSNLNPTSYTAFSLSNKNCTTSASITPSGATSFCNGGSVTLTASAAHRYKWNTNATTQAITANTSATYTVTLRDSLGCVNIANQAVTVWSKPVVDAGVDTVIVAGDTIQLNTSVTSGTSPYTYSWSPITGLSATNVANPFAHPDTLTDYIVTVTDDNGCVNKDTLRVWAGRLDFTMSTDTANVGDTVVFINTSTGFPSNQKYTWDLGLGLKLYYPTPLVISQLGINSTNYSYLKAGNDTITISANNRKREKPITIRGGNNFPECCFPFPSLPSNSFITDGSFENLTNIAGFDGNIVEGFSNFYDLTCGWSQSYWLYAAGMNHDIFGVSGCDPNNNCQGIPASNFNNIAGFQNPQDGNWYAGLVTATRDLSGLCPNVMNYREYIQQDFPTPLEVGKKYRISFWVSASDHARMASRIQCIVDGPFTNYNGSSTTNISTCGSAPLVGPRTTYNGLTVYSTSNPITNDVGWTNVQFDIIGNGETLLMIGYFDDVNNNDVIAKQPGALSTGYIQDTGDPYGWEDFIYPFMAYYYIDNITISLVCEDAASFDFEAGIGTATSTDMIAANGNNPIFVNQDIYIGQNFVIDQDITFQGCRIRIATGKRIDVLNGFTLAIENNSSTRSQIMGGCGDMWDKIRVFSGATLTLINTDIADGVRAIVTGGSAVCTIENCVFNYNHIGIDISASTLTTNTITGTTFKCEQSLPFSPHRGELAYAGVNVKNTPNLPIGDPTSAPNLFDGHRLCDDIPGIYFGIHAEKSGLNVYNNTFDYLWNGVGNQSGPGNILYSNNIGGPNTGEENTFLNCINGINYVGKNTIFIRNNTFTSTNAYTTNTQAIQIYNPGAKAIIRVRNNIMTDFYRGISVSSINDVSLSRLIIDCNTYDYTSNYTSQKNGIWVNHIVNTPYFYILNNTISFNIPTEGIIGNCTTSLQDNDCIKTGILVQSSIGSFNTIARIAGNTVTATPLLAPDVSSFSNLGQRFNGIRIEQTQGMYTKGNTITDISTSIYGFGNLSPIYFQCNELNKWRNMFYFKNALISTQGSSTLAWKNYWNTRFNNTQYANGFENKLAGTFYSNQQIRWYYLGSNNDANAESIEQLANIFPLSAILPMANTPADIACYAPGSCVDVPTLALEDIDDDSGFIQSLYRIAKDSILYESDSALFRYTDLQHFYKMVAGDTSLHDGTDSLEMAIDSVFNYLKTTNIGYLASIDTIDVFDKGAKALFDSLNNVLTPVNVYEDAIKDINNILSATWYNDVFELDSVQKQTLLHYADTGFLAVGYAAYRAMAILGYPILKEDYISSPRKGKPLPVDIESPTEFTVQVYPNPGTGSYTFAYNLNDNEMASVAIYNYTGSLIKMIPIYAGTSHTIFNISTEANGIYYYKFVTTTGNFKHGKIILSR